jgi:hypothetical protein
VPIVATRWSAGENKFRQNLSSTTDPNATSLAAGPNGMDIANSIDIGTARANSSLWVFGDTFWNTAAGQTRSQLTLIRNPVGLQVGRDLSSSTLTFHTGGTAAAPLDFFDPVSYDGNPFWKYPLGGVLLDDRVLVVGMLGYSTTNPGPNLSFSTAGPWATILHSVATGAPTTWPKQDCRFDHSHNGFHLAGEFALICNPIDAGDGFVYFYWFGPSGSNQWAVSRCDRALAKSGDLTQMFWWDGGTRWLRDVRDSRSGAVIRRRLNVLGQTVNGTDQLGGVTKRTDSNWQLTGVPTGWYGAAPTISYAISSSLASAFGNWTTIYNVPLSPSPATSQDFVYGAYFLPEQTWSGKAAADQFIIYSRNRQNLNLFTDATSYWPEVLQVTGI